ncbi:MAG: orotate phosphoribosyltransferase [Chlamydiales bacterium]
MLNRELALRLFEIGMVKFGSFTLKSGLHSPVYLDLRLVISYPELLSKIAEMMWKRAEELSFQRVCGVPYTALPIATCFSVSHEIPMLLRRKEVKEYGTKKQIEGVFQKGETCLILEDVMTTGSSILETAESLQKEGLIVRDAVLIIDREQGGRERLNTQGIQTHSLLTLAELATYLYEANKINQNVLAAMNVG